MSGIPVYTQSPIKATRASGTSPQTAAPPTQSTFAASAATTTTAIATSTYPPAQPVTTAFSAPTAAAQRYVPVAATPTPTPTPTTKVDAAPAPPQPGAVPVPLSKNPVPPPPKADVAPSQPQPYPHQMAIPPPTSAYGAQPPSSSTSTTMPPSASYPVPVSSGDNGSTRRSLEHPPGYQQNVYASELTSDQRRAQEAANYSSGLGAKDSSDKGGSLDAGSLWNAATGWAQQAGNKLSEVEQEVWRKINKP